MLIILTSEAGSSEHSARHEISDVWLGIRRCFALTSANHARGLSILTKYTKTAHRSERDLFGVVHLRFACAEKGLANFSRSQIAEVLQPLGTWWSQRTTLACWLHIVGPLAWVLCLDYHAS